MLLMAERWFWQMQTEHECGGWDMIEEWRTFGVAMKIRRFMTEVRAGHPTAVHVYAGSDAEVAQAAEYGTDTADESQAARDREIEGMSDAERRELAETAPYQCTDEEAAIAARDEGP